MDAEAIGSERWRLSDETGVNSSGSPRIAEIFLAPVEQDWLALDGHLQGEIGKQIAVNQNLPCSCRDDPLIALVAVIQNGAALRWAGESCRRDRARVLAAVEQAWRALECVGENCKNILRLRWRLSSDTAELCNGLACIAEAIARLCLQLLRMTGGHLC
eukprot:2317391-Amphidinium_carterae.1